MKLPISIIAFFDRRYNLLFHKDKCIKIKFSDSDYNSLKYDDVVATIIGRQLRYMGKNYWKFIKTK